MTDDDSRIEIRAARPEDGPRILELERELADFERLRGPSPEEGRRLVDWIFRDGKFRALVAEANGTIAGMAIYFLFPTSFRARPALYLEDIVVDSRSRSRGIGEALFAELARVARDNDCVRIEWAVLDWNERALDFYRRLGAKPQKEWLRYALGESDLRALAGDAPRD
ncbi:MAG: GNAT family N-acetyltransferase [Thermoanaerobaculia bacterium]